MKEEPLAQHAESAAEASAPSGEGASAAEEGADELRAEIVRLRARVAELESARPQALSAGSPGPVVAESAGQHSYDYLQALVSYVPNIFFIKDLDHRYVAISKLGAQYQNKSPDEMIGRSERDMFPLPIADKMISEEVDVLSTGKPLEYEQALPHPDGLRYFYTVKFPIYNTKGAPLGVGAFITDITEMKRVESERLAMKEQVIRAQQAAIRELSTPLVPLAPGVLAMPLVGTVDSVRAHEILETLLDGIARQSAHTAILDITGVRVVDTQVADALVSAARAARLLGARMVLTGISPAVAQTLVHLEAKLDGIVTLGTLAHGIAFALQPASAASSAAAGLGALAAGGETASKPREPSFAT